MRILIVDDSEQTSEGLRSSVVRGSDAPASSIPSRVFAALQLPQVITTRLTRLHAARDKRTATNSATPTLPDIAKLHLENSPELLATLLNTIGLAYLTNGDFEEAQCFIEQALEIRFRIFGAEHPQTAASINSLARVHRDAGQLDDAMKRVKEALGINSRISGGESLAVAGDLAVLASIEIARGALTETEHAARSALKIFEDKVQGSDPWVPYLLDLLARVHQWRSDYARASEFYQRIRELDAKLYGRDHPVYAVRQHNYGTVLEAQGDLTGAMSKYDEAIEILEKCSGHIEPALIDAISNRGALQITLKDLDAARRDLHDSLERNRKLRGADHPMVGYGLLNLAQLAFEENNFDECVRTLDEALKILRAKLPARHAYIAAALTVQGRALVQAQKPAESEALLEEASSAWRSEFGERSPEFAIAQATLARAWFLQGKRLAEVEPILKASLAAVVAVRGDTDPTSQLISRWLKDAAGKSAC